MRYLLLTLLACGPAMTEAGGGGGGMLATGGGSAVGGGSGGGSAVGGGHASGGGSASGGGNVDPTIQVTIHYDYWVPTSAYDCTGTTPPLSRCDFSVSMLKSQWSAAHYPSCVVAGYDVDCTGECTEQVNSCVVNMMAQTDRKWSCDRPYGASATDCSWSP
jgi:hypothetical protein